MNDDEPFGVLATVESLNTMRIDEGDTRCMNGGNAQLW